MSLLLFRTILAARNYESTTEFNSLDVTLPYFDIQLGTSVWSLITHMHFYFKSIFGHPAFSQILTYHMELLQCRSWLVWKKKMCFLHSAWTQQLSSISHILLVPSKYIANVSKVYANSITFMLAFLRNCSVSSLQWLRHAWVLVAVTTETVGKKNLWLANFRDNEFAANIAFHVFTHEWHRLYDVPMQNMLTFSSCGKCTSNFIACGTQKA